MTHVVNRILGAVSALLLISSIMACGGSGDDPDASSAFKEICQVQADCLDDQFDKQYGTVEGCAEALKANADFSSLEGQCRQATLKTFECQADNIECSNNQVVYNEACKAQAESQALACSDFDYATEDDIRELCTNFKDCVPQQTFEETFGTIDQCINTYQSDFDSLDRACKRLASDYIKCDAQGFQCVDGEALSRDECVTEYEEFQQECTESSDPELATEDDFRDLCTNVRDCVGQTAFNEAFGSVEQCISDYQSNLETLDDTCKRLASDYLKCDAEGLRCIDGEPRAREECRTKFEEFQQQCGG